MGLLTYLQNRRSNADDAEYRKGLLEEQRAGRLSTEALAREAQKSRLDEIQARSLADLGLVQRGADINKQRADEEARAYENAARILKSTFGSGYNFGAPLTGPVVPDLQIPDLAGANYVDPSSMPTTTGYALKSLLGPGPVGETLPALAPRMQATGFGMNAAADAENLRQKLQPGVEGLGMNNLANANKAALIQNDQLFDPAVQAAIREGVIGSSRKAGWVDTGPGSFGVNLGAQKTGNITTTGGRSEQTATMTGGLPMLNDNGQPVIQNGQPVMQGQQPSVTTRQIPGSMNINEDLDGNALKTLIDTIIKERSGGMGSTNQKQTLEYNQNGGLDTSGLALKQTLERQGTMGAPNGPGMLAPLGSQFSLSTNISRNAPPNATSLGGLPAGMKLVMPSPMKPEPIQPDQPTSNNLNTMAPPSVSEAMYNEALIQYREHLKRQQMLGSPTDGIDRRGLMLREQIRNLASQLGYPLPVELR